MNNLITYSYKDKPRLRTTMATKPIFRYKFTEDFASELHNFAKIHQYDDRATYKDAWVLWLENNNDIVHAEYTRLTDLDYDGDIMDKMFKSARYYFRKKSTEKKTPVVRRPYTNIEKELLDAMDTHIQTNISNKPSDGYIDFMSVHDVLLQDCINDLYSQGLSDREEIHNKIKKTYKNRYFRVNLCRGASI